MKSTIISILITLCIIGAAILFVGGAGSVTDVASDANNVSVVDGKQIIEIRAKGRYYPYISVAQAGIPTIIRFTTSGTFDCTSVVRIPSMDITKNLPQSETTDIDIGSPQPGIFEGTCGMGMYSFEIDFQ